MLNLIPQPKLWDRSFDCLHINGRVHKVYIFLVQFLPQQLHSLTEALEVDYLTLPQELDHIVHIRIV